MLDERPALTISDDLLHPDILPDPYPVYAHFREHDPVHWNEVLDSWMIMRYADVLATVTNHERLSSDRTAAFMEYLSPEDRERFALFAGTRARMMIYSDPPRHTRLRGHINHGMTPRMVESMRARIQAQTDELIDQALERGRFDVISDLALPLPATMNAALLGVPVEDHEQLKRWTTDFINALSGGGSGLPPDVLQRGQDAVAALHDYLGAMMEARRRHPTDDLMSAFIGAEGHGTLVDDHELYATCINMLFAGLETVVNLIGNGTIALLRHPDQLALLRREPGHMRTAIEEFLRYDCPVQLVGRLVLDDVEVGGRRFTKGDKLLVVFASANRDPRQFPDPDRLDVTRRENRHLTFSQGIHYCAGAALARMEGDIAFSTLLRRLPDFELAPNTQLRWHENVSFRGLVELPLAYDQTLPAR